MTIAEARRSLARPFGVDWRAASGLLSTLLVSRVLDSLSIPGTYRPPKGAAPWDPRTRKTPPAGRIHPSGPPPTATSAVYERVLPAPARVGSHMIPAPVRSVPPTDRWCLQLPTSMQRGCDTSPSSVVPIVAATVNGHRPPYAGCPFPESAASGRPCRSLDCLTTPR